MQINSEDEAKQRVIEYALVMARPMVLYQADHPVHWSPVFLGGKSNNMGVENENRRRLVTTVSTPVYDRRNHSVRVANLLGVVGTDVPIEDIKKMVPQYKVRKTNTHQSDDLEHCTTKIDVSFFIHAAWCQRLLLHFRQ